MQLSKPVKPTKPKKNLPPVALGRQPWIGGRGSTAKLFAKPVQPNLSGDKVPTVDIGMEPSNRVDKENENHTCEYCDKCFNVCLIQFI